MPDWQYIQEYHRKKRAATRTGQAAENVIKPDPAPVAQPGQTDTGDPLSTESKPKRQQPIAARKRQILRPRPDQPEYWEKPAVTGPPPPTIPSLRFGLSEPPVPGPEQPSRVAVRRRVREPAIRQILERYVEGDRTPATIGAIGGFAADWWAGKYDVTPDLPAHEQKRRGAERAMLEPILKHAVATGAIPISPDAAGRMFGEQGRVRRAAEWPDYPAVTGRQALLAPTFAEQNVPTPELQRDVFGRQPRLAKATEIPREFVSRALGGIAAMAKLPGQVAELAGRGPLATDPRKALTAIMAGRALQVPVELYEQMVVAPLAPPPVGAQGEGLLETGIKTAAGEAGALAGIARAPGVRLLGRAVRGAVPLPTITEAGMAPDVFALGRQAAQAGLMVGGFAGADLVEMIDRASQGEPTDIDVSQLLHSAEIVGLFELYGRLKGISAMTQMANRLANNPDLDPISQARARAAVRKAASRLPRVLTEPIEITPDMKLRMKPKTPQEAAQEVLEDIGLEAARSQQETERLRAERIKAEGPDWFDLVSGGTPAQARRRLMKMSDAELQDAVMKVRERAERRHPLARLIQEEIGRRAGMSTRDRAEEAERMAARERGELVAPSIDEKIRQMTTEQLQDFLATTPKDLVETRPYREELARRMIGEEPAPDAGEKLQAAEARKKQGEAIVLEAARRAGFETTDAGLRELARKVKFGEVLSPAEREFGDLASQGGMIRPLPEGPAALKAQHEALLEGRKPGILILPGQKVPAFPRSRYQAFRVKQGLLIIRRDIPVEDLREDARSQADVPPADRVPISISEERLAQLLGYPEATPEPGRPAIVVTGRTPEGAEGISVQVSPEKVDEAAAMAQGVVGPGGTVETGEREQIAKIQRERAFELAKAAGYDTPMAASEAIAKKAARGQQLTPEERTFQRFQRLEPERRAAPRQGEAPAEGYAFDLTPYSEIEREKLLRELGVATQGRVWREGAELKVESADMLEVVRDAVESMRLGHLPEYQRKEQRAEIRAGVKPPRKYGAKIDIDATHLTPYQLSRVSTQLQEQAKTVELTEGVFKTENEADAALVRKLIAAEELEAAMGETPPEEAPPGEAPSPVPPEVPKPEEVKPELGKGPTKAEIQTGEPHKPVYETLIEGLNQPAKAKDMEVSAQWAIVPVRGEGIKTSFDEGFLDWLQPREFDIERESFLNEIIGRFDPRMLGQNIEGGLGAPVIGTDGMVEGGNGRMWILRRIYSTPALKDKADAYRTWLVEEAKRLGMEPKGEKLQKIMEGEYALVRIRKTPMTPAERRRWVENLNAKIQQEMNRSEQARIDAGRLTAEMADLYKPGEAGQIDVLTNREFVQEFLKVVARGEGLKEFSTGGVLSQEGSDRIRNAIFAWAYGEGKLLKMVAEQKEPNVKTILDGMIAAGGQMARMKAGIEKGQLYDLGLHKALNEAVEKLSELRDLNARDMEGAIKKYVEQAEMFGDPENTALVKSLVDLFGSKKQKFGAVSKIKAMLNHYADVVEAMGDPRQGLMPGMERDPSEYTRQDILARAIIRAREEHGESGTTLFGPEPGKGEGAGPPRVPPPAPEGGEAPPEGKPPQAPGPEAGPPGGAPGRGPEPPTEGVAPKKPTTFDPDAAKAALDRLKKKLGKPPDPDRLAMPERLDPSVLRDAYLFGGATLQEGTGKASEWAASMKDAVGEGIDPYLEPIWDRLGRELKGKDPELAGKMQNDFFGVAPAAPPKEEPRGPEPKPPEAPAPGPAPGGAPDRRPGVGGERRDIPGTRGNRGLVVARAKHTQAVDESAVPQRLVEHLGEDQRQGVAKAIASMEKVGGFTLADGTGSGKSRQILGTAEYWASKNHPVLIIAPAGVLNITRGKVTGSYADDSAAMRVPFELAERGVPLKKGRIYLNKYSTIDPQHVDFDTVLILDESHALKNSQSQRTKTIMPMVRRAKAVMFVSATPADKAVHIHYMERAGLLEGKTLKQAINDLGMIERTVKIAGGKTITVWGPNPNVTTEQRIERIGQLYDRLTAKGHIVKREITMEGDEVEFRGIELPPEAHSTIRRIEEFFLGPGGTVDQAVGLQKANILGHMRRQQEPYKLPMVMDLTKKELAAGRQVILFFHRVRESEVGKWVKEGWGPNAERVRKVLMATEGSIETFRRRLMDEGITEIAELHGEAENKNIAEEIEAFNSGKKKVALVTPERGGVGINLGDAKGDAPRTVIVVTSPFSAVDNMQGPVGRAIRRTTKSSTRLIWMFARNEMGGFTTVEKWNMDIIATKMAMLNAAVKGQVERLQIDPDLVTTENFAEKAYREDDWNVFEPGSQRLASPAGTTPQITPAPRGGHTTITGQSIFNPTTWLKRLRKGSKDADELKGRHLVYDYVQKRIQRMIVQAGKRIPGVKGEYRHGAALIGRSWRPWSEGEAIFVKERGDVITLFHEMGHHFQQVLMGKLYGRPRPRSEYVSDQDNFIASVALRNGLPPDGLKAELNALLQDYGLGPASAAGRESVEAYAQWLRLQVIDPAEAARRAPLLDAAWGEQLHQTPELVDIVRWTNDWWRKYQAADPILRIRSHRVQEEKDQSPLVSFGKDILKHYYWFDRFSPLKKAFEQLLKYSDVPNPPPSKDVRILADVLSGAVGEGVNLLETGTWEFRDPGVITGAPLQKVLESVMERVEDFKDYAIARRAVSLAATRQKTVEELTGLATADVEAVVRKFQSDQVMRDAYENYKKWHREVLTLLKDSGLMSKETYKGILKNNEDYTPLYRLFESAGWFRRGPTPGGGALGQIYPLQKRLRGSRRPIHDPIRSSIRFAFAVTDRIDRNEVLKAFYYAAKRSPEAATNVVEIDMPKTVTKINVEEIMRRAGIKSDVLEKLLEDNDLAEFVTLFQPSWRPPGENTTWVWVGGKRYMLKFADDRVFRSVMQLDKQYAPYLLNVLSAPLRLQRSTIVLDPTFMARNITRDQISAIIRSQAAFSLQGLPPSFLTQFSGLDAGRGILKMLGASDDLIAKFNKDTRPTVEMFKNGKLVPVTVHDPAVQKAERSGASQSHFFDLSPELAQKAMIKAFQRRTVGKAVNPVKLMLGVLDGMREMGLLVENMTRLTEGLKLGLETAKTRDEMLRVGIAMRRVSLDFGRAGVAARFLNQFYLFLNPDLQGLETNLALLKNPATRQKTAMGIAGMAAAAALLRALYVDDKRLKAIPPEIRSTHFVIPHGDGGLYIKSPKPQDFIGAVVSSAEALVDYVHENDPSQLRAIRDDLLQTRSGGYPFPMLFPSAAAPLLEVWGNWRNFPGRPILSQSLIGRLPEHQETEFTSETAKGMAAAARNLGISKLMPFTASPEKMQHVIGGYLPGAGPQMMEMLDLAVAPEKFAGKRAWARLPVVRGFVGEQRFASANVDELYDLGRKNEQVVRSYHYLLKKARSGRADDLQELQIFVKENDKALDQAVAWRRVTEALTRMSRQAREIRSKKDISDTEKARLTRELNQQADSLAKRALEQFRQKAPFNPVLTPDKLKEIQ